MIVEPSDVILALNGYPGVKRVQLRGHNAAIDTSAETIWGPGGTYAKLTTGTALEVVSASANDTAAGTGARTVVVKGLDGNYLPFSETVSMDGTGAVALVQTSVVAINQFYVATVGSGGTNAGVINVRTISGSTVKSQITTSAVLGLGQAADFIYTIPDGYVGVLGPVHYSTTGITGDLTVYLNSSSFGGVLRSEGADKAPLFVSTPATGTGIGAIAFGRGIVIPAKTMIELRALVSAGNGALVAMAELLLVQTTGSSNGWGSGG